MTSFIQTLDEGIKSLVFLKFANSLGLNTQVSDLVFYPKSIALRKIAERRGKASVDFISVWRPNVTFNWERQRSPLARRGMYLRYVDDNEKSSIVTIKAVPVSLEYEVSFWSLDLNKIMLAAEKYAFWVHQRPQLLLSYNDEYPVELYLELGSMRDESTLEDTYGKGGYFVYSAPIRLEGWLFEIAGTKTILTIYLKLWYNEDGSINITSDSILLAEYELTQST